MKEIIELYKQNIDNKLVPLMEIRNNKRFNTEFHSDIELLYIYCINHKQKWEDVLGINLEVFSDVNNLT